MAKKESTAEAFAARPVTARCVYVAATELPGERWWCACGKSERQPFCDGSHRGGPVGPSVVTLEETLDVRWCCCKRSSTPPWCDGSQECLPEET
jgi:CDGSH-type Zn-finger protein